MKPQLLDLFSNQPSFNNFITISNTIVVDALKKNNCSQFTHITGVKSSGKTHLLKAWINHANSQHKSSIYIDITTLDLQEIRHLATYFEYIAIDNIDYLNANLQIELFDLFNSIKLNNRENLLLTTSSMSLENLFNFRNDLKTRILSGLTLLLKAPDDEEIIQALKIYSIQEGIKINDVELKFCLTHYTRNIGLLINLINKIAELATLEKRHITISLIKHVVSSN
ncbi:MAG: hypothetical protein K2P99_07135 [Burkholderiales bacterium]|nr:hypothetical protein [Burkholderiales bacterium]